MTDASPGPWRLSGDQILAPSPHGGELVIAVVDPGGRVTIEEERANGRLLAASLQMPAMLRWCETQMHEDMANARFSAEEIEQQLEGLRAIIAKATGDDQ